MNSAHRTDEKELKGGRNLSLDFFRGIALLIIFIGHSIGNPAANIMPRNFGFSDASEIFVFCSGLSSAYGFGPWFAREGFFKSTMRVLYRVWQIYWVHIALAFSVIALMVSGEELLGHVNSFDDYDVFFAKTQIALPSLMTLRWLPAYLDILPLYLFLLAGIPFVMLLRRLHWALPFVASIALYLCVWIFDLHMHQRVPVDARWFFNPFAWQLMFFSGYFVGMGWVKAPRLRQPVLLIFALFFVVAAIPFATRLIYMHSPLLLDMRSHVLTGLHKHNLHILRIVHFFCLAYVMMSLLSLKPDILRQGWAKPFCVTGQQVLGSFVAGIFIARAVTLAYEMWPQGAAVVTVVATVFGCAAVMCAAYVTAYFKRLTTQRPVMRNVN